MNYTSVVSSNVAAVAYCPFKCELGIRFHGGREYHYFNVPIEICEGLLSASSVGRYLHRHVKLAGYAYQRIT